MGVIGSVTAFTHLSMAEALVLIFSQPAYITVMSVFFLKERVGFRRWSAVALGFLGVLIVLRPGFRPLSIGHLGALFAGLGGAVSVVAFRAARGKEKNVSLFGAPDVDTRKCARNTFASVGRRRAACGRGSGSGRRARELCRTGW